MKIVSEQSEEDFARRRAVEGLSWPLRTLAANMLRVVRGAGRPWELPQQMAAVLTACEEYREAVGSYPSSDEISGPINVRYPADGRRRDAFDGAAAEMVQGALQMAASQIIGQSTQEAAGRSELFDGVRRLEAYWERQRTNPPKFTDWADDDT